MNCFGSQDVLRPDLWSGKYCLKFIQYFLPPNMLATRTSCQFRTTSSDLFEMHFKLTRILSRMAIMRTNIIQMHFAVELVSSLLFVNASFENTSPVHRK